MRCSARRRLGLVRERGERVPALVGVDHEQVHGVGADVEDPQAHDQDPIDT
ncbi:hypothetical protein GCM10025868_30240 [Angustibacter aerolatus]|uniref:Uncharacterized protein n=1 Tax=Angustibacter aerolatus TaxID=1162965 RepID=A0ABQ6JK69_9ACTN|nr:hypothetical protein GCM10025868_30240 [Angustibacter aerolatus]